MTLKYLVTTPLEKEFVAKTFLEELDKEKTIEKIEVRPFGFFGLLIIYSKNENVEKIFSQVLEIEKWFKIEKEGKFKTEQDIISSAVEFAENKLSKDKTLGIRVNKRGEYAFKSIEIEKSISKILSEKGFTINFKNPEVILDIEILPSNWFGIALVDASIFYKKYENKPESRKFFKKVIVGQLVYYTEDDRIANKMGEELGRSAQAFEIKKLIFLIDKPIDIRNLWKFLRAADYGAFSRYVIQKKAYTHEVKMVDIKVYELYQFLRSLNTKKDLIIITDPRGKPLNEIKEQLKKEMKRKENIIILNGSDHGIPTGCFRFAHFVIDLSPKIVFSTEQTITASLISLLQIYLENNDK